MAFLNSTREAEENELMPGGGEPTRATGLQEPAYINRQRFISTPRTFIWGESLQPAGSLKKAIHMPEQDFNVYQQQQVGYRCEEYKIEDLVPNIS